MTEVETEYRNDDIGNVGEGWQPVVLAGLLAIERVDPGCTVDQIKEKFGGLRFYVTPSEGADDVTKFIVQAIATATETRASNLCEDCGGFPARNEPVYKWYRTLCPHCRAKAWVAAHERMTSPASEFPVDEEIAKAIAEDPGPPPWDEEPDAWKALVAEQPDDPPTGMCADRSPHEPHRVDGEGGSYLCIGQVDFPAYDDEVGGDVGESLEYGDVPTDDDDLTDTVEAMPEVEEPRHVEGD